MSLPPLFVAARPDPAGPLGRARFVDKLKRHPTMQLEAMEDIAGVRVVLVVETLVAAGLA